MNLPECIAWCAGNAELVAEFNRLTGRNLGRSLKRSPMDRMVDDACGVSGESEEDMIAWANFITDVVWMRLPDECFVDALEET